MNVHRSSRFDITTKLDRDKQISAESHRSTVAFALRFPKRHTQLKFYACDNCHITFGTAWLEHCPLCGSSHITQQANLAFERS